MQREGGKEEERRGIITCMSLFCSAYLVCVEGWGGGGGKRGGDDRLELRVEGYNTKSKSLTDITFSENIAASRNQSGQVMLERLAACWFQLPTVA